MGDVINNKYNIEYLQRRELENQVKTQRNMEMKQWKNRSPGVTKAS